MAEETKQWAVVTEPSSADDGRRRAAVGSGSSRDSTPGKPSRKRRRNKGASQNNRVRKRATKVEMDKRNSAVAAAATEFQARHDRLPTVGEIAAATGYSRQQIYSTAAYKEGMISRNHSKPASNRSDAQPAEGSAADRFQVPTVPKQPLSELSESTAADDGQDAEQKPIGPSQPSNGGLSTCYVCGCQIPTKQQARWKCPRCGKGACATCLELMDHLENLCVPCQRKAGKRKEIWDTIGLVGVILLVVTTLAFLALIK